MSGNLAAMYAAAEESKRPPMAPLPVASVASLEVPNEIPGLNKRASSVVGGRNSARGKTAKSRYHDFFALHQQYQKVDKEGKLSGFNKNNPSQPFLIILSGIKNLCLKDTSFGSAPT